MTVPFSHSQNGSRAVQSRTRSAPLYFCNVATTRLRLIRENDFMRLLGQDTYRNDRGHRPRDVDLLEGAKGEGATAAV